MHTIDNLQYANWTEKIFKQMREGDVDAGRGNRRSQETSGRQLLSQQGPMLRAQQSDGRGVLIAGTAFNWLVGSDPSSNGIGDEFHRHWIGRQ